MSVGIHAFGAHVPQLRLERSAIAAAHAWWNPGLIGMAKGQRAMANWDEDAVTMAVEAARDCLGTDSGHALAGVYLASTTMPFQDRQNSGVVAEALSLGPDLLTLDMSGSQRAGTSALTAALQTARGADSPILIVAADKRRARASSSIEMTSGDGAAALLVGPGCGVAQLLGRHTHAVDFVDHYRGQDNEFDYVWEERWTRDEGYMKLVPISAEAAMNEAGVTGTDIDHFCFPAAMRRVAGMLAKKMGIAEDSVRSNLHPEMGEAGAAHAMVMLVHALEAANPGELILVTSFGQGSDALVFEVTDAIKNMRRGRGVTGCLSAGRMENNYMRYLAFNDLIELDRGLRAEVDKQTGMTTLYRNKDMILSLFGGKCRTCGTLQFPKSNICVNPNCGATHSQDDHRFPDTMAKLNSFTADRLTYSPDPPAYYGMVEFIEGGRAMIDFTDVDPVLGLEVGMDMRMVFRVKDYDMMRGFRRYFWKAAPVYKV
ncbi:MAG: 3-hydroxy-3-methylglutaryl CoA synthase [Rhodospirillaceae bacterium TMED8]|nr:3-hydroxy-3-methylglutaryl CoA synthase [Magnetovibrio sp.]OUT48317.1 MAG: 3-hydroxy-3-methylglutaryl CoA synthase [Rhodospirillaceae bacterium TMED8]|tara:strand:+ start:565 stop:2022 length:1458 start_codon:yes stop_codon:yes gene_type:complete